MTTTIEPKTLLPVLSPALHSALVELLGLPDVSSMPVEKLSPEDLVTFAASMEAQLRFAAAKFKVIAEPITDAINQARGLITKEILNNNGRALAHHTFDVRLEQATERDKRIDVLRGLEGKLPDDLYRAAVYEKTTVEWHADLRLLDKHARDFGGEIAAIVEQGSPRVAKGAAKLVIEPRPSALKAVS
jgi:hypothetical protein